MLARTLRNAGLGIMGLYAVAVALFIFGDALTEPGGWTGILTVAASMLVILAAALAIRRWPLLALPLLIPVVTASLVYHAMFGLGIIDPSIEGPGMPWWVLIVAFLPIPVLVLAALHAWSHQVEGAIVLVSVGILFAIARPLPGLVLGGPAVVAGALLLASSWLGPHGSGMGAGQASAAVRP